LFEFSRSVQVDEEMQSADETTATDDAGPSPSGGVKIPVSDSTASAQNDEDAPSQSEPNLGLQYNFIYYFCMY
jgi:SWI/SNF related-matrix-associated actin-dependent regulator of chromatin subfamily C